MDLFAATGRSSAGLSLQSRQWPSATEFPVNVGSSHVEAEVWPDLAGAASPLVVTGFAAIEEIINLTAVRSDANATRPLRVVLGTEPFVNLRAHVGDESENFDAEVRRYWIEEHGISIALSARVIKTIEAIDAGLLQARFFPGRNRLHAKIYVGDDAVTLGSSNFTGNGLRTQHEANARFTTATERARFVGGRQIAENYWDSSKDWTVQLRALLWDLLRTVTWEEALARACTDLLDGEWAARYVARIDAAQELWPSQRLGIAHALWVMSNLGSVLVADATGSGKTRMGAHLTRAVVDELWSSGRARNALTVMVGPPAVLPKWKEEAISCGLSLEVVSHGKLSRTAKAEERSEARAVAKAQVLALDEAHNFLAVTSKRSAKVRASSADNVVLFTATPINRGARDLLALIDYLGADNFEPAILDLLDRTIGARARGRSWSEDEQASVRDAIQEFTVRRTKAQLNALVDEDPELYRHVRTGRVCRYPEHHAVVYGTGETEADREIAAKIRDIAHSLKGLGNLGDDLAKPAWSTMTDNEWGTGRVKAAAALASHRVFAAMRSSRAALYEHVAGTEAAIEQFKLAGFSKSTSTGNMLRRMGELKEAGAPEDPLNWESPAWIAEPQDWARECELERERYASILELVLEMSDAREQRKAHHLLELNDRHERVLSFDRHPITLHVLKSLLGKAGAAVYIATGGGKSDRDVVMKAFAPDATGRAIALCSDAMNEGVNLQGASTIVNFDLPTTMRVAEQRVGRVDRMDSPHDRIEVWWPQDSTEFATRAAEMLAERNAETTALLGSNLELPILDDDKEIVRGEDLNHQALDRGEWDGLKDVFAPVRALVEGDDALVPREVYEAAHGRTERVVSRISVLETESNPWAFFALRNPTTGAPIWMLLEDGKAEPVAGLGEVAQRLRERLSEGVRDARGASEADHWTGRFVEAAQREEIRLLPRKLQRALDQMAESCAAWAVGARHAGDFDLATRWEALRDVARGRDANLDWFQLAHAWLRLTRPIREQHEQDPHRRRRHRYRLISDIDEYLRANPLPLDAVEAEVNALEEVGPLERRIASSIIAIPRRD